MGKRGPKEKFTEAQKLEIYNKVLNGGAAMMIAQEYGCGVNLIYTIIKKIRKNPVLPMI